MMKLDYLYQYPVKSVTSGPLGTEVSYTIHFEGGGAIYSTDHRMKTPTNIVGKGLINAEELAGGHTELIFVANQNKINEKGSNTSVLVLLRTGGYKLSHPVHTKGEMEEPNEAWVDNAPPHPDEREADGPTGPDPEDEVVDSGE